MATDNPRIPPLPMSEWGAAEKDALSVFIKNDGKSLQGGNDKKDKDMSAIALLLNHPALAKAIFPLTRHLLYESFLPARERELMVLRVSWHRRAKYEWAQHIVIWRVMGLPDEDIVRVTQGAVSPEWSDKDRLLISSVDQLLASASMSDETWDGLKKYFNQQELMELVTVVGAYDLMAMVFNSFGVTITAEVQAILDEFPF